MHSVDFRAQPGVSRGKLDHLQPPEEKRSEESARTKPSIKSAVQKLGIIVTTRGP